MMSRSQILITSSPVMATVLPLGRSVQQTALTQLVLAEDRASKCPVLRSHARTVDLVVSSLPVIATTRLSGSLIHAIALISALLSWPGSRLIIGLPTRCPVD